MVPQEVQDALLGVIIRLFKVPVDSDLQAKVEAHELGAVQAGLQGSLDTCFLLLELCKVCTAVQIHIDVNYMSMT